VIGEYLAIDRNGLVVQNDSGDLIGHDLFI
jgi:hypothetical protein